MQLEVPYSILQPALSNLSQVVGKERQDLECASVYQWVRALKLFAALFGGAFADLAETPCHSPLLIELCRVRVHG